MFLAIDIGNTHTVFGIYREEHLVDDWRVTSTLQRTADEVGTQVHQFLLHAGLQTGKVSGIGIASVVPNLTDVYEDMSRKYFNIEPVIITASMDLGIQVRYENPNAVGADRVCNAVAGYAKYGGPLIIIDFGTATTYDVVGTNGDYLGGVIAPGVETSAADLHRRAAKLPKVELHLPLTVIGTDTVSSMQAGILWGTIDAMEGMIGRIQEELRRTEGKAATVIGTGGFSAFVSKHSRLLQHLEPSLVLDGLRLIAEKVRTKHPRRR